MTKTRKLKVEQTGHMRRDKKRITKIRICGQWLLTLGFVCGRRVTVQPIAEGQIILTMEGGK